MIIGLINTTCNKKLGEKYSGLGLKNRSLSGEMITYKQVCIKLLFSMVTEPRQEVTVAF